MSELVQSPSVPENGKGVVRTSLDFPVVGIGASAGGLLALQHFFERTPEQIGMAFVVILHLSPKHQSSAAEILQRTTKMAVVTVNSPTAIEKNHVYIIPPGKQLSVTDGYLRVSNLDRPLGQHVAIDFFFRSLADTQRERAIGIVLSGTGADGTVGLSRLKEQGGITIAQEPADAEHGGMPRSAIATGIVDFVLPVAEMPQKLQDLWSNARVIQLPPVDDPDAPSVKPVPPEFERDAEEALQDILAILRTQTGHDFRHYKRATVLRRIERRMQVRSVSNLPDYRAVLKADSEEAGALLSDMLIGVTNFFRDRDAFEAIEREVVPLLFTGKKAGEQVRVWVTACSTGEEAYSIAMLLCDQESRMEKPPDIQVFATDIDDESIAIARKGAYPHSVVADISQPRIREYFVKDDTGFRIKKNIRDKVLFASHNLLRDPPFSKLDLITCRNLLIYLNREMQSQVLEMFHFALNPGGFLFLGSSESAESASHLFTPVDKKNRIYRAKALSRSMRHAPAMPFAGAVRTAGLGITATPQARKFSFGEVHQRVLSQYAPPSVIVNQESNIVHMSDRAGRFLRHIGGEPSRNLVSLVYPELRLELRTALFQAMQSGKSVEARRVQLKRDDRNFYVNMTARPFHDDEAGADFVLVLFDEVEEAIDQDLQAPPGPQGDKRNTVLTQLEEELQRTKEQLQETMEHSETSNEELKASNEELQAINEELRSATEELETSKEELQSVNEELVTVNYELKVKVEETSKVNDDLNNLIASTDIATVFVDRGMRIKRFTPRATDIFNIISSDIDRSLLDITHRLNYEKLADDVAETFDSLRLIEREVRSTDGRFYIARMLPYRTTEDRIDGAILTFIDVTARREAEEKLRAGEERMRLVAESTKDYAIITCDTEGRITSFNKGAERIFGFAEQEVLGEMIDIFFAPEDREQGVPAEERRLAREVGRADDERWHIRKDGTRLFCSGVMTPLLDGGRFYGYAKIARDQIGQANAQGGDKPFAYQEEIARAVANTLRDEFLAIMSHELRHPLNLIHINAELLARLPEVRNSPLGSKATAVIQNSVLGQAKIIDDLLDLSRVKTGKLTLSISDVDLSAVVNSIVNVMQADPAAAELNIEVIAPQTPLIIRADLVRIEQVVLNLMSNAVKFTQPGGHITIRLSQEEDTARLEVIDDGKGMPPEFVPHAFDMFGQAAPVNTRSKGGLGIGLALVRQITELHGGRVEAASEGLGKGSRFSVWLPLYGELFVAPKEQNGAAKGSIAGLRILLVDDMVDLVTSFKILLELEGALPYTATSAAEALKILDTQDVDLVISDISMPDMDGHMFIREVRKKAKYAQLPAIAVSGMARPQDIARVREAGFSAFLSKPVSLPRLIDTVKDLRLQ